jgi:hypothetical protein
MIGKDYIPQNLTAFAAWILNFHTQLQTLAAKYGISAVTLASLGSDNAWTQYWAQARIAATQQEKQITDFITQIADGELGKPVPTTPQWSLPPNPPPAVETGIKKRIREIANAIKNQKSIYTRADGELLGIVTGEEAGRPETDYQPALKLQALAAYHLQAEFRKMGLDAVRFEIRRKNGEWSPAADSAKSPADFLVTPEKPGDPEQIEVRAIFLKAYKPFGSYSPIYTATIAP